MTATWIGLGAGYRIYRFNCSAGNFRQSSYLGLGLLVLLGIEEADTEEENKTNDYRAEWSSFVKENRISKRFANDVWKQMDACGWKDGQGRPIANRTKYLWMAAEKAEAFLPAPKPPPKKAEPKPDALSVDEIRAGLKK